MQGPREVVRVMDKWHCNIPFKAIQPQKFHKDVAVEQTVFERYATCPKVYNIDRKADENGFGSLYQLSSIPRW